MTQAGSTGYPTQNQQMGPEFTGLLEMQSYTKLEKIPKTAENPGQVSISLMSDCCEIAPVLALKLPVDNTLRSLSGRLSWDKAHAAATLVGAESASESLVFFTCCTSTGADLAILSWFGHGNDHIL